MIEAKTMTLELYKERLDVLESHPTLDAKAKLDGMNGLESTTQVFLLFEIRDLLKQINEKTTIFGK